MTARQLFEGALIDLNKINAPTLKLYEFNYLCNKAINQYVNKIYNIYDINQQTSDDLRVLKSNAEIKPTLNGNVYEFNMPSDYLHLLNCVCVFKMVKSKGCYKQGDSVDIPATRLTSDSWGMVMTDVYNRPSPMKPYYYLHNRNSSTDLPTNPYTIENNVIKGTDSTLYSSFDELVEQGNLKEEKDYKNYVLTHIPLSTKLQYGMVDDSPDYKTLEEIIKEGTADDHSEWRTILQDNIYLFIGKKAPRTFKLNSTTQSAVNKPAGVRHSNVSPVRCEIRCGKDTSIFELVEVKVDYIKSPQYIRLTQAQLDLTEDTSQMMEFPDYINQEIINELVHLVMERSSDPRLSTNLQITQSIARPTQQQQ